MREPNPVAQIITTRGLQAGAMDAAALAALYALVPSPTFWHAIVPTNAVLLTGGLCAYFASVFVPGVLPQPLRLFGIPPRFFRLSPAIYGSDAIALTFDDGPHPETTPRLLHILNQYQAKSTFFLVGERAAQYPGLVARIAREGHTIGVHGLRHRTMVLQSAAAVANDLTKAQAILEAATGKPLPSRLLRPPYGFKTGTLSRTAARLGWTIVDWSLDVRDYDQAATPETLLTRLESGLTYTAQNKGIGKGGDIVLLHEQIPDARNPSRPQTTIDALPRLLEACHARGLRFEGLSPLPPPPKGKGEPV